MRVFIIATVEAGIQYLLGGAKIPTSQMRPPKRGECWKRTTSLTKAGLGSKLNNNEQGEKQWRTSW
jgi:hypothetical protein